MLNAADHHRVGACVVVALTTGMRPGEVSGLTWDTISFEQGIVTVFQSMGWTAGQPALKGPKTGHTRTLALPAPAIAALRAHRKDQTRERLFMGDRWPQEWSGLVFVTTNGTPIDPSNLRKIVSRIAADAGIEGRVTPYDMRHSVTSLIADAGQSAERLADMLGHRDTRMVHKHYRHPVTSSISVAAEYWGTVEQADDAARG